MAVLFCSSTGFQERSQQCCADPCLYKRNGKLPGPQGTGQLLWSQTAWANIATIGRQQHQYTVG